MHPTFCILQDIRTGKIIGRSTERQGLYYVDEVVTQQGTVMLAHGSTDREAWLWHRRLGHPSTRVKLTDDLDGIGLVSKGRRSDQKFNSSSSRIDKTKLKCENCGMTKHTKEQCFEIVGYPDWWVGNKKGKSGKATAAVGSQETIDSGSGSNTHQKGHSDGEDHWA
nr:putative ribonuclease H-like domain-containing protein [Tanacetum cinerariifolium]